MTIASVGTRRLFYSRCCTATRLAAVATSMLMLAGCGPDLAPQPQTARPTESTQTDFGDLEVHYNAVRTDQLSVEVARAYGIERSANRVLLNVAMLQKTPGGAAVPVDGAVTVRAHNLNAQLKDLQMRRVQEGTAVYFHRRGRHQRRRDHGFQHHGRARHGRGQPPGAVQAGILRGLISRTH